MKCEICGNKVNETFLKKVIGTMAKDEKGKQHYFCFECQKKFQSKEELLKNIR